MKTEFNVKAELNDSNAQVVAKVGGREVTRGELKTWFDMVADKKNWKMPVDAVVPLKDFDDMMLLREAIVFYTGSNPSFESMGPGQTFTMSERHRFRVKAAGYYAAVGA
jgi:hypothetical protein